MRCEGTEMLMAAMLAKEVGLTELAVVLGLKMGETGLSGLERIGCPTGPTPPVVNDWVMVHAIGRQESEFDRNRESHAGARGLMQVLPSTAKLVAPDVGLSYDVSKLNDPTYNVRIGTGYLAELIDQFGPSVALVAAGLLGGVGQILLTSSYREADASLVAPFDYASMLFALAIGWFVFAEMPTVTMLSGAALIVAAGILIILRERRLGKNRAQSRKARARTAPADPVQDRPTGRPADTQYRDSGAAGA